MAYNSNKGTQNFGDIHYDGDPAETQIDFEDDLIALKTKNVQRLIVSSSAITASVIFSASAGIHAGTFTGDGAGLTGIPAAGVAAAGDTTEVQYNNGGALAGSSRMVFNGSTLTVQGLASTGNTTLGDASGDSVTINAATVDIPNVAAGTDNTVVVYNGSTLLTDEIDSRVWQSGLIDNGNTVPVATQISLWTTTNSVQGLSGLTYDSSTLAVTGAIAASTTISAPSAIFTSLTASALSGGSPITLSGDTITLFGPVTSTNDLTCSATVSGSTGQFGILEAGTLTVDGNTTLGSAEYAPLLSLTLNPRTINIPNVQAGTDNTVVVYDGSTLLTDEIDSRVWGSTLVDVSGTPAANQIARWSDANTAQGASTLTYNGTILAVTGAISASTNISASAFYGDATNMTGLPVAAISNYNNATDNRVITSVDASTVQGEANLTFDGSSLAVSGLLDVSRASHPTSLFTHPADSVAGGIIDLLNSRGGSAGQANDFCGGVAFKAPDSTSTETQYGKITTQIGSPTNGGEDGRMYFEVTTGGVTSTEYLRLDGLTNAITASKNTLVNANLNVLGHISASSNLSASTLTAGGPNLANSTLYVRSPTDNSVVALFKSPSQETILGITGSGRVVVGGMHLDGKFNVTGSKNDKLISLKSDTGTAFYVSGSGDTFVSGNIQMHTVHPMIEFTSSHAASSNAQIGINNAGNILVQNNTSNQHIVFKASDNGTIKEGLRLDGSVPEVVVNQTAASLLNFRVESRNNPHMLYVSGSTDQVGVGVSDPAVGVTLDVSGSAIRLRDPSTPANASHPGVPGEIRWDADYIYICVGVDTWKKAAISTW